MKPCFKSDAIKSNRREHRWEAIVILFCLMIMSRTIVLGNECIAASPKGAYRAADVVFRGTVIRVEDPASVDPGGASAGEKLALQPISNYKIVTLAVIKTWKGPPSSTNLLFVLNNPRLFIVGTEYVVYALDEVAQDWSVVRRFSQISHVYGIGVGCILRVRMDAASESRILNAIVSKNAGQR